jgi:hypothetical protein
MITSKIKHPFCESDVINSCPGCVFTILHFLPNLGTGPISYSVCHWPLQLCFMKQSSLLGRFVSYDSVVTMKIECCEYGTLVFTCSYSAKDSSKVRSSLILMPSLAKNLLTSIGSLSSIEFSSSTMCWGRFNSMLE